MDFTDDVDALDLGFEVEFGFGFELRVGDVGEVVSDMLFVACGRLSRSLDRWLRCSEMR